jgi:hypothetical protein
MLPEILRDAAQKVLQGCSGDLWPPRVVNSKNPKDRLKTIKDSGLVEVTTEFTDRMLRDLSISLPSAKPGFYDASFLRLFDSVGTFTSTTKTPDLLGIALAVPVEDLNLWGTSGFVFKHNCSSLLGVVGTLGSQYAVPLFSLDAALKASQNSESDRVFVLTYGSFQSPFELFYSSGQKQTRLFASFRALRWRQAFPSPASDQILTSGNFLTLDSNIGASDNSDVFGSLKLGVHLPFISASGELNAKVAHAFQLTGQGFLTYFWNEHYAPLRTPAQLIGTIEGALPDFDVKPEAVSETDEIRVFSDITGWPLDMCDGNWKASSLSKNFANAKAVVNVVSPPGVKPQDHVCHVEVRFTLSKPAPGKGVELGDPKIQFERTDGSDRVVAGFQPIHFRLAKGIRQVGQPDPNVDTVTSLWQDAGDKATWTVGGKLRVESGRRILSKSIDKASLTCAGEKGDLILSDITFDDGNRDQSGDVLQWKTSVLLMWSTANFDKNPKNYPSGTRKSCVPSFNMTVLTDDGAGSGRQNAPLLIKAPTAINYPDELPAKPGKPKVPKLDSTTSSITLSWEPPAGSKYYRVSRLTDGALESRKLIKDNYVLNTLTDKDVEPGHTYTYAVTAVNPGGDSDESDAVSGSLQSAPAITPTR